MSHHSFELLMNSILYHNACWTRNAENLPLLIFAVGCYFKHSSLYCSYNNPKRYCLDRSYSNYKIGQLVHCSYQCRSRIEYSQLSQLPCLLFKTVKRIACQSGWEAIELREFSTHPRVCVYHSFFLLPGNFALPKCYGSVVSHKCVCLSTWRLEIRNIRNQRFWILVIPLPY